MRWYGGQGCTRNQSAQAGPDRGLPDRNVCPISGVEVTMRISRREFLRRSGCGIGSAAALAAGIERFGLINAMAQGSGYKALVCVFLAGGNDGNNMIIPAYTEGYSAYSAVRGTSGLAIAQGSLLPIVPRSLGLTFGLHPSLAALHPLFDSGNLAVVCNVGPLVEPITKEAYLSGAPKPYQLFSHSDQIAQWQSSVSTGPSATGWGGRVADTFGPDTGLPKVTALAGGAFTRDRLRRRFLSLRHRRRSTSCWLSMALARTPRSRRGRRRWTICGPSIEAPRSFGPRRTPRKRRSTWRYPLTWTRCWQRCFPTHLLGIN